MDLIDQIEDDRDALVVDSNAVLEIADELHACDVDFGKPFCLFITPRNDPSGLDPGLEPGGVETREVEKPDGIHAQASVV